MFAEDIQNQLKKNGLFYDPLKVESEAFGEGFEQCAMTWKAMVIPYLGLANPPENNFDLSVSGARFLAKAKFKERVKLANDVQLYLWEGEDNRPIGFYARAWCQLKDPQFYTHIQLDEFTFEVWSELLYGTKHWPAKDSPFSVESGHLKVPVLNGIRRDSTDGAFYLIGQDISFHDFRQHLVKAKISE